MNQEETIRTNFIVCTQCLGRGKKSKGLSKNVRKNYQNALRQYEHSGRSGSEPILPKAHLHVCLSCNGSGIVECQDKPIADVAKFPHVAIVGAGIGGVALAIAFLHRNIPFTLYERDQNFEARSQGYGLTLQQATKAVEGLGITSLKDGVISTKHIVHKTDGEIIGSWGNRKWIAQEDDYSSKRTNIHIARQSLRQALLEQLGDDDKVSWGHQLLDFTESKEGMSLEFIFEGQIKKTQADIVVGADGIRSIVRKKIIGDQYTPLRYLDCIVILGICPLAALDNIESPLLDSATVFQTANGNERIYVMPYDQNTVMWQLSFPMAEQAAIALSLKGPNGLKAEAVKRTNWHSPVPQIIAATPEFKISGYPVYDRKILTEEDLKSLGNCTLIGDAAHPMSPFKGQGANQALLDALSLANTIYKVCNQPNHWERAEIRETILKEYERDMLLRSAVKVKDSGAAAQFLHSNDVLRVSDAPRGSRS
ncbi:NAD(P)/FAD-dependent oxidoreductase [Flavobacterium frigidarium]|uniref:FAD-dependent oxidoreductase n=1 Tax=Flavobacterium frigidarium TaxID=99286 RepID=UPI0030DAE800